MRYQDTYTANIQGFSSSNLTFNNNNPIFNRSQTVQYRDLGLSFTFFIQKKGRLLNKPHVQRDRIVVIYIALTVKQHFIYHIITYN
jgi:hypothetical protein